MYAVNTVYVFLTDDFGFFWLGGICCFNSAHVDSIWGRESGIESWYHLCRTSLIYPSHVISQATYACEESA